MKVPTSQHCHFLVRDGVVGLIPTASSHKALGRIQILQAQSFGVADDHLQLVYLKVA